ncbi:MAG: TAXI family TRAP transporter solute-binding subunit [Candidatus Lustribacter sp.]|jgi:TRAP transporter TAXI family solute receptor
MSRVPAPKIDRSVTMNWMGDWGRANLHRALGVLCYEFNKLAGPYSKIGIWNGRGALDNIQAVGRGEVDLALVVPQNFIAAAMEGRGLSKGEAFPHLRALGHYPQHDRMIMAVRRDTGITSFDDIRRKKPKLRITTGVDDGITYMGYAAQQMMAAAGIPRKTFEAWGGTYVEREEPRQCTDLVLHGEADAIIQEAVMTYYWEDLANKVDLTFIPIEPNVRDKLKSELGWESATLRKDYLRGLDREMEFMDFSHFVLTTTTDMPDDIAYALAWASIERFASLEIMYRHIPPERSPISYPIDPVLAAQTPIPLHPGAERYYREAGHLA